MVREIVLGLVFMGLLPWPERVVAPGLQIEPSQLESARLQRAIAATGSTSGPPPKIARARTGRIISTNSGRSSRDVVHTTGWRPFQANSLTRRGG